MNSAHVAAKMKDHAGFFAFADKKIYDLPSRAVTEQLSELLFVEGDAVVPHHLNKVLWAEAGER